MSLSLINKPYTYRMKKNGISGILVDFGIFFPFVIFKHYISTLSRSHTYSLFPHTSFNFFIMVTDGIKEICDHSDGGRKAVIGIMVRIRVLVRSEIPLHYQNFVSKYLLKM